MPLRKKYFFSSFPYLISMVFDDLGLAPVGSRLAGCILVSFINLNNTYRVRKASKKFFFSGQSINRERG